MRVFFVEPKEKGGSPTQQHRPKRSWQKIENKKPLSPSGRNNGSQVHKINKWVLRKQMGSKEPEKREITNSKPMDSV